MLNCRETTRLASDRFERRLSLWEWGNFLMHIAMCPLCRRFTRQLGWLHSLVNKVAALSDEQLAAIGQQFPFDRDRMASALQDQEGA